MTTTNLEELFTNLDIVQSDEPLPAITRPSRSSVPNPFGPALAQSLQHSTPYSIYVPADAVQRAVSLINAAARKSTPPVGVRVVVNVRRDDKGQVVKEKVTGSDGKETSKVVYLAETKGENKGKVLVRFQANADRKKVARYGMVKDPSNGDLFAIRDREEDKIVTAGIATKEEAQKEAKRLNK